jgi:hypothetical protein
MDIYSKSFTIWLLWVAVLLGRIMGSKSQTQGRRLTDHSGIVNLDFSWQGLMSVPAIGPGQLVQTLDLSHNSLHDLHNESFHPYPNVTKLVLSSNNITRIEVETFSNLQALTKVDLSYNNLTFIHPSTFVLNINLQTLSLQGNPLCTLEPGTSFLIAKSLQSLDLSHCHLLQFSADSLSGLPQLKILDLRQNNLRQLSMNNMPALSSLQLTGNPWQCDCHFHALLMWVSTNHMIDSDIRTDNTVQCWLGDELRDLVTEDDRDSICIEATGLLTGQKKTPELAVTSSKKDYAMLDKNSDSNFPADNIEEEDDGDVWMYEDDNQEIFNSDDNDSEESDVDTLLFAGEFPDSVHQDYTGLNMTVSTNVGFNHNELSRKYDLTNATTQFLRLDNNFVSEHGDINSHGEFSREYEGSEEFDNGNISLMSAEIPSSSHQDSDLTLDRKIGDNHTQYDLTHSAAISLSADDNFVPEGINISLYEYDFYGAFRDSEEMYYDFSVADNPDVNKEDYDAFIDENYTLENSNLQELHMKTELSNSTADSSSQSSDVIMDGVASDKNHLITSDSILTDTIKNDTLNNSLHYDNKCIFCDNYADPATEIQNLKHNNEYKFSDSTALLEKVNSEDILTNAEDIDSTLQFKNTYDDFNPEDIGDPDAFHFDNLDSTEVTNNELVSDTINFRNVSDEDNFDIDSLIASILKSLNSATDVQEHETLVDQFNDKPPNETNLKIYTVIRFLILVGMVSVIVFLLIIIFYCITSVHHTTAYPMQVNGYEKLKNSTSKNEFLQNI